MNELTRGEGLQMAISFQIGLPLTNSLIELQITPRISDLPIKTSVLYRQYLLSQTQR